MLTTKKVKNEETFHSHTSGGEEGVKIYYSNGYPKVDLSRPGADEKLALPVDIVDFKTPEGREKYRQIVIDIESRAVEKNKESFLRSTAFYVKQLKKERSLLEKLHEAKVLQIKEEKKELEDSIAEINEKILEAIKRGEEDWNKYKQLLLR